MMIIQVDSVHVMEKVVVSGSRDRGISVWAIDQVIIVIKIGIFFVMIIIAIDQVIIVIIAIIILNMFCDQVLTGGEENSKPCSRNPDMHKGWVRTANDLDDGDGD